MGSLHCTASPAGIHTDPGRRQSTVLKKQLLLVWCLGAAAVFPRLNAQCTLWPCRNRRGEAVHWQHRSPACSDARGMHGLLSGGSFRLVGKGHFCYSALHLE